MAQKPWWRQLVGILSAGILLVLSQTLSLEALREVLGHTMLMEELVVILSLIGFLIGLKYRMSLGRFKKLLIILGVCELAWAAGLKSILIASAQNSGVKILIFLQSILILISVGQLVVNWCYRDGFNLQVYKKIHLFAAAALFVLLFTLPHVNQQALHIIESLGFFAAVIGLRNLENVKSKKMQAGKPRLEPIVWGGLSGVFINYFFNYSHAMLYPSGLEFHFYLLIIFFFLYVAAAVHEKSARSVLLTKAYIVAAIICLTSTMTFILTNKNSFFIFDPAAVSLVWPFSYYPVLEFSILLFLLLPYLVISWTVPVLQNEDSEENYLFYTTLGSVATQLLLLFPGLNISLKVRLIILLIGILLAVLFWSKKHQQTKPWTLLSIFLLALTCWAAPSNIEDRLTNQARRFYGVYWASSDFLHAMVNQPFPFRSSDLIKRFGNKLAAVGGAQAYLSVLTLDGYSAETYLPHDYIKSQVTANEMFLNKPQKILLLGLGNHLVLKKIVSESSSDSQIDIIDNSPFFSDQIFLQKIASESDFSWRTARHVNLISADAFQYIFNTKNKYDLIVWNLTLPNYLDSIPLFSRSFAQALNKSLNRSGTYIVPFYDNPFYDCVNSRMYQKMNFLYMPEPLSLAVFSGAVSSENQDGLMRRFDKACEGQAMAELGAQFEERNFDGNVIKKKDFLNSEKNLSETSEMFSGAQNFNRSLVLQPENPHLSVILDVPVKLFGEENLDDLLYKAQQSSAPLSISYYDNYAESHASNKIRAMLSYYAKPKTQVLTLFSSFFSVPQSANLVAGQSRAKKFSYLDLSEKEFFIKQARQKNLKKVLILAQGPLAAHLRSQLSMFTELGSLKEAAQGDFVVWDPESFGELPPEVKDNKKHLSVYMWQAPWKKKKAGSALTISWYPRGCDASIVQMWLQAITEITKAEQRSFVIQAVADQKELNGQVCKLNLMPVKN